MDICMHLEFTYSEVKSTTDNRWLSASNNDIAYANIQSQVFSHKHSR
jgi:hypothetical protein